MSKKMQFDREDYLKVNLKAIPKKRSKHMDVRFGSEESTSRKRSTTASGVRQR